MPEMLPVGVRRDGSYYTRVMWANVTEKDPKFWVNNMISDDHERNGGTYGANTEHFADVVLDFWGETQKISKIRVYKNVGITISVPEELARYINIFVSTTDEPAKIRTADDDVNAADWKLVKKIEIVKEFGWQDVQLDEPVLAKYVRVQLEDNFCKRDETFIPWCETSEVKFY